MLRYFIRLNGKKEVKNNINKCLWILVVKGKCLFMNWVFSIVLLFILLNCVMKESGFVFKVGYVLLIVFYWLVKVLLKCVNVFCVFVDKLF